MEKKERYFYELLDEALEKVKFQNQQLIEMVENGHTNIDRVKPMLQKLLKITNMLENMYINYWSICEEWKKFITTVRSSATKTENKSPEKSTKTTITKQSKK